MKKTLACILLLGLLLTCAACGGSPEQTPPSATAAPQQDAAPAPEQPAAEPIETEAAPAEPSSHSTVLVVYFSATGNTRQLAERIAALTGGDLAEIIPAQPYTAEDLNYNSSGTRATLEQNDPDARPEIANSISLEGYTTVYLGYPIWWGQAPRILSSFVESHDFTGITVIPFCTSGSSGAGSTGETLGEQAGTGTFLSSTRLSTGISDVDLQDWIDSRS